MASNISERLRAADKQQTRSQGRNDEKHSIVLTVEGVVEVDGITYVQGVRTTKECYAVNGQRVCVTVPEDIQKKDNKNLKELMTNKIKYPVKVGGKIAFRDAVRNGVTTFEVNGEKGPIKQEYSLWEASFFDILQHNSTQENIKFLRSIPERAPNESTTLSINGPGYTKYWSQKQNDGSLKPTGRTVIFRPEQSEMRTISSMDELKSFIKESFENYKPTGLHATEVRRIRIIDGEDAFDTGFELYSNYQPDAFESNGQVVGGYVMPDEYLTGKMDEVLRSNKESTALLHIINVAFEEGYSFDIELLCGKNFNHASKSLAKSNMFNADGSPAPAAEGFKMTPLMIENGKYLRYVPVTEGDQTVWRPKQAIAHVDLSVKVYVKEMDEGASPNGQSIIAINSTYNAPKNAKTKISDLDTNNFKAPRRDKTQNTQPSKPSKPVDNAQQNASTSTRQSTNANNEQKTQKPPVQDEPKFDETDGGLDINDEDINNLENQLESFFNDSIGMGPN